MSHSRAGGLGACGRRSSPALSWMERRCSAASDACCPAGVGAQSTSEDAARLRRMRGARGGRRGGSRLLSLTASGTGSPLLSSVSTVAACPRASIATHVPEARVAGKPEIHRGRTDPAVCQRRAQEHRVLPHRLLRARDRRVEQKKQSCRSCHLDGTRLRAPSACRPPPNTFMICSTRMQEPRNCCVSRIEYHDLGRLIQFSILSFPPLGSPPSAPSERPERARSPTATWPALAGKAGPISHMR
jgi:hypothetical protein